MQGEPVRGGAAAGNPVKTPDKSAQTPVIVIAVDIEGPAAPEGIHAEQEAGGFGDCATSLEGKRCDHGKIRVGAVEQKLVLIFDCGSRPPAGPVEFRDEPVAVVAFYREYPVNVAVIRRNDRLEPDWGQSLLAGG